VAEGHANFHREHAELHAVHASHSDSVAEKHSRLEAELGDSVAKAAQLSDTIQNMQSHLTSLQGLIEERASEANHLRAEMEDAHAKLHQSYDELRLEHESHSDRVSQENAQLAAELNKHASQSAQHCEMLKDSTFHIASVETLVAERAKEASQIRMDMESNHTALQKLCEELREQHSSHSESVSNMHARLSSELGDSVGKVAQQAETIQGIQSTITSLQELLEESAHETSTLRAELTECHANLQKDTAELRAEHVSQGEVLSKQQVKLEAELGDSIAMATQQAETIQGIQSNITSLQDLVDERAQETSALSAEVAGNQAKTQTMYTDLQTLQQRQSDTVSQMQAELAAELSDTVRKLGQQGETIQSLQHDITGLHGLTREREEETSRLRAEMQDGNANLSTLHRALRLDLDSQEETLQHLRADLQDGHESFKMLHTELRSDHVAHCEKVAQSHTEFSTEFNSQKSEIQKNMQSAVSAHESLAALEALVQERAHEMSQLRKEMQVGHANLQSLHGDLCAEQESQNQSNSQTHTKLAAELGENAGKIGHQGEMLKAMQAEIADLQDLMKDRTAEIGKIEKQLVEAHSMLGATITEEVQALDTRQNLQIQKRADEIQGVTALCDALQDEMIVERRARRAATDMLSVQLRDEIMAAEKQQEEELKKGIVTCLGSSDQCHKLLGELQVEQQALSAEQARQLCKLHSELHQAQTALEQSLQAQVKSVESKHSLQLQQRAAEIEDNATRCLALSDELSAEARSRRTANAELTAELRVNLNCTEKQAARQLANMKSELMQEVEALSGHTIPELQAELKVRMSALSAEMKEASEDAEARHSDAIQTSVEVRHEIALELETERKERLSQALGIQGSLAGLQVSLSDGMAELEGRLDQQKSATAANLTAMVERMDGQKNKFSTDLATLAERVSEQSHDLVSRIDQQRAILSANLTEAVGRMEQNGDLIAQQMERDAATMQALIEARAREAQALQLELDTLRSSVATDIDGAVKYAQSQQEQQIRLLAEDADDKTEHFMARFQQEEQARGAMSTEFATQIQGWSELCHALRSELGGLRSLILQQAQETNERNREADAAASRDGLLAPTMVGTAAMAAAFLL